MNLRYVTKVWRSVLGKLSNGKIKNARLKSNAGSGMARVKFEVDGNEVKYDDVPIELLNNKDRLKISFVRPDKETLKLKGLA